MADDMSSNVRVRFAPSPTGYLHVGGARTALFNYLFARHHRGTFVLRIEDTDQKRFQEDALREIFTSLKWLGLDWDEGPEREGELGPYLQSHRTDLYNEHAQSLLDRDKAYLCFCTPERLERVRQEQHKIKMTQGSGYDRHCRGLSKKQVEEFKNKGKPHVVRLKVPREGKIIFKDLIRGEIEYSNDVLDDLVLLKSDGYPTYHLANVVDDHFMKISHVLRGDEWISSTPRHILLYEAFGWKPPHFAHLPVILSQSGGKLSKRKGAASVLDYKNSGFLADALFNFLALLGWAPGDDRELMAKHDIIKSFSLKRVSPKAAVFDEKKLEWMNGHYLRESPVSSIFNEVVQKWEKQGLIKKSDQYDNAYLKTIIGLLKDRVKKVNDIAHQADYFFEDPREYDAKAVKKHFKGESSMVLKHLAEKLGTLTVFDQISLEKVYREMADELNLSAGKLIHPTRLAISGVSVGPGLFEMMEVLGKEKVINRINRAVLWLEPKKE
jgi:glutamyl-tRNA synthetase